MDFSSLSGIVKHGFSGFITISELQMTNCIDVPKKQGVYLILRLNTDKPRFLTKSIGGHFREQDPTVTVDVLKNNWLEKPIVVYIGKAGGSGNLATLQNRLKQYMDFGRGKKVGHKGGRYIWQLADSSDLQVCWLETPDEEPDEVETRLIKEFKDQYGKRPFANLSK